jgi:hypothetical protein
MVIAGGEKPAIFVVVSITGAGKGIRGLSLGPLPERVAAIGFILIANVDVGDSGVGIGCGILDSAVSGGVSGTRPLAYGFLANSGFVQHFESTNIVSIPAIFL